MFIISEVPLYPKWGTPITALPTAGLGCLTFRKLTRRGDSINPPTWSRQEPSLAKFVGPNLSHRMH